MKCLLCPMRCPATDRLQVQGGVAHWACVVKVQLDRSPTGKVLVMVGRKGFRSLTNVTI